MPTDTSPHLQPRSLALRLACAALLAAALLGVGASGWLGMQRLHDEGAVALADTLERARTLAQARQALADLRRYEKDMVIHLDRGDELDRYRRQWVEALAAVRERAQQLATGADHAVEAQRLLSYVDAYARHVEPFAQQLQAGGIDGPLAADRLLGPAKTAAHAAEKAALAIDKAMGREVERTVAATHVRQGQLLALHGIFVGVALALALPAALFAMSPRLPRPPRSSTAPVSLVAAVPAEPHARAELPHTAFAKEAA